jgi:MFS family permease
MADSDRQTMSPTDEARGPTRSAALIVFLVVFIDLLGFGIVLPLLPFYATELLEPLFPGDEQRILRGALLGLLMSSFSLMQFVFAPIWGRISDRIGRRPILLLGLGASAFFYGLFGVGSEIGARGWPAVGLTFLYVARIGAGIAGGTIATAQAVIADSTPPDRRAHGMALIGIAFGIGFTFGPLFGFASLLFDSQAMPGLVAGGLSLLAFVLALRLLPETLRTGSASGRRGWLDWRSLREVLRMPTVGLLVVTFFLATWGFGGLEATLALATKVLLNPDADPRVPLTKEALRSTERYNFLIFAFVGLVLMLVQGLIYRRLVGKIGEAPFLKLGSVLMTIGVATIAMLLLAVHARHIQGLTAIWALALPVLTVCVSGYAFMTPSIQALISRRSDPARQGEVLGVNQSAAALARILGPLIAPTLFFVDSTHVWPYVFGAGLLGVATALTFVIGKEK